MLRPLLTRLYPKLLVPSGLLGECTEDSVNEDRFRNYVPEEWYERIRTQSVATESVAKKTTLPLVSAVDASLTLDLSDFNLVSDVWTSAGGEPSLLPSFFEAAESSSALIRSKDFPQSHRQSPCLPGALVVDPLVRKIVRENHAKVSETAIWLLIVAVREYVQAVLKNTVTNLASVDSEQSMRPIKFAPYAIRSWKMSQLEADTDKEGESDSEKKVAAKDNSPTKEVKVAVNVEPSSGEKKRRITSLDIASALNGTRVSSETLAGSVTSLAYERCCLSFNGNQPSLPPALDSVRAFVVESMESAAKKPKHEWRDPDLIPIAPAAPVDTVMPPPPKPSTPTKPSSRKSSGDSSRSPTGGLEKEGNNFASLKARAAAAAELTTPVETAATGKQSALPSTPPATCRPSEQAGSNDLNVTPPNTCGVRQSPSISPRGRGRGFGVKNLAAMRARNVSSETLPTDGSTPPPKQQALVASPSANSTESTHSAGKELRRLEQVQGRKAATEAALPQSNVSPATAARNEATSTGAGMIPVGPLPEPEAMDTTH